jgi:cytochrome c-type biogenesis protein CcmH/NrfF
MPTDPLTAVLFSLAPTVLLGLVFWFIMRAIVRSDRNERAAYAKVEAEERAKLATSKATPEA